MEYLFPLILLVAIAEIALSGTWAEFYFRRGLPLFRRRVQLPGIPALAEEELAAAHSGGLSAPLVFKRFSAHEVAFREKAFGFHLFSYTPIMHGLIRYEPEEGCIHVIGWANWFILALAALSVWMFRDINDIMFPVFLVGVVGVIYAIQAHRYSSVARVLSRYGSAA